MKANRKFLHQSLEFWTNVKLISERTGYTDRLTKQIKVPTTAEIRRMFENLGLDASRVFDDELLTPFGVLLIQYFKHRAAALQEFAKPNLMDKIEAKNLFYELKEKYPTTCPFPLNKQSGDKKDIAFLTGIVNILVETNSRGAACDFSPNKITTFTSNGFPARSLSRRVDGAFPGIINPIAIWEIKEYYSTTTFGSRIADGVYETLLDGFELREARTALNREISHYLMIDAYDTWWRMGKSYLCRICDMLHMGLLTEVLFGKEVVDRIPQLVKKWIVTGRKLGRDK